MSKKRIMGKPPHGILHSNKRNEMVNMAHITLTDTMLNSNSDAKEEILYHLYIIFIRAYL